MPKFKLELAGMEELIKKHEKLGKDIKKSTETALRETHTYITPNLHKAMGKHELTGHTEKAIQENATVKWNGLSAEIAVGFNISDGGLASIFLMYGTPRMTPDRNLYNTIYGTAVKKEVKQIQENVFLEAIRG